jgi:pimeloyl-ACP methyl ester carboxylesterase
MKTNKSWLLISLLFVIISSCKKDNSLEFKERGSLIAFEQKGHFTARQIVENVDKLSVQGTAVHGVTYYSITYRTEYDGKQIDTKGLLILPDDVDSVYLIAYFKGTQLPVKLLNFYDSQNETPSNYNGGKENFLETRNMGLTWASAGYTVFMPDYIGFGSTIDKEHPYLYYPEMFKANIDGLIATKQFIANKGLAYDNRLFLTGWSEGGGACLSAHKYIQETYTSEFTVVASSGLAGPYHFNRFIDVLLSKKDEDLNISNIFSWGVYSLNKFSDLKRPTDQIFAYPVYDQFAAMFPPSKKISETLNNYFLSKIMDDTDVKFRQVLDKNTFSEGWKPVGKVYLHHGDADNVVYFFNSTDARDGLTAAGGDVKLYTYPGGGHVTELENYITKTLGDFNLLK